VGSARGFPAALTSFIGRAGAVLEVAGLLEEYRLVTVTGPVGLDFSILLACRLRSSLGDLLGRLPARALPARLPDGTGPA
jgi:hypothetical protein